MWWLLLGCGPEAAKPGHTEEHWDEPLPEDTDSGGVETPILDEDGDGYTSDVDCDDHCIHRHPGALESWNIIDDDCDGEVDEDALPFYRDDDGDGYGNLPYRLPTVRHPPVPFRP